MHKSTNRDHQKEQPTNGGHGGSKDASFNRSSGKGDENSPFHNSLVVVPHTSCQEAAGRLRQQLRWENKGLITPGSNFMMRWDAIGMVALFWTALITPYEIAFKEPEIELGVRFLINRIFDVYFIIDIGIQFFLPYHHPIKIRLFVKSHRMIAKRYMKFWFWIDVVASLPYDLIPLDSMGGDNLKMLRTARMLKWLKVLRVLKGSAIFKRWEAHMTISYATLSAIKLLLLASVFGHWVGCVWGMVATSRGDEESTWVVKGGFDYECTDITGCEGKSLYVVALYWAAMTMSAVGYGDITASNQTEYITSIVCITVGGAMWAYIMGNICGLVTSMNPNVQFQMDMDAVNGFMATKSMNPSIRVRVKEFLFANRDFARLNDHSAMFTQRLSPALATDIARAESRVWAAHVPLIITIEMKMSPQEFKYCMEMISNVAVFTMFAPKENIPGNNLTTVMSGLVARGGRLLHEGQCFGEEMLLPDGSIFKRRIASHSAGFVETVRISRGDLANIERFHPKVSEAIASEVRMIRFRLGIRKLIMLIRANGIHFKTVSINPATGLPKMMIRWRHKKKSVKQALNGGDEEEGGGGVMTLTEKKLQVLGMTAEDKVEHLNQQIIDLQTGFEQQLQNRRELIQALLAAGNTPKDGGQLGKKGHVTKRSAPKSVPLDQDGLIGQPPTQDVQSAAVLQTGKGILHALTERGFPGTKTPTVTVAAPKTAGNIGQKNQKMNASQSLATGPTSDVTQAL